VATGQQPSLAGVCGSRMRLRVSASAAFCGWVSPVRCPVSGKTRSHPHVDMASMLPLIHVVQ
jgi:hypothetical protein